MSAMTTAVAMMASSAERRDRRPTRAPFSRAPQRVPRVAFRLRTTTFRPQMQGSSVTSRNAGATVARRSSDCPLTCAARATSLRLPSYASPSQMSTQDQAGPRDAIARVAELPRVATRKGRPARERPPHAARASWFMPTAVARRRLARDRIEAKRFA
jgi:hypothetical protein